jgi:hypothetical protein
MTGAVDVYGLAIAWHVEGLADDSVAQLLAGFPLAAPQGAPDVLWSVAARPSPAMGSWRELFRDGDIRCYADADARIVVDGQAWARIHAGGQRIDVDPRGAPDRRRFVESTLLLALDIALREHGLYALHAGAVITASGRRVLIVGASGAGKTTTVLSLLAEGTTVLGDDAMFFAERDGSPRVLAFPRPFHVTAKTLAAFPALADAESVPGWAKHSVPFAAVSIARALDMEAPELVLLPQVTDAPTSRASPVAPADAFGALLDSTAAIAFADRIDQIATQLGVLERLIAGARAWRLELGADALVDPRRLAAVVEALP